jgi:Fe-S-cluster containining protein
LPDLHLPIGINYECTSCGKCCGGWAVPMTEVDYDRISEVRWGEENPNYQGRTLFRELKKHEADGTPYTHKIVAEGPACPFLVDNLCFMHSKFGSEFKPSICQLFPYSFSETPTGVYATVSFVSVGVIYNSGKPLAEQHEQIQKKWDEFKKLYPDYQPDWSHIRLTADQPITWHEYLQHEARILECLDDTSRSLEERLCRGSFYLEEVLQKRRQIAAKGENGNAAGGEAAASQVGIPEVYLPSASPLNSLDQNLLVTFHNMYFPCKTLKTGEVDFNMLRLVNQSIFGKKSFAFPEKRSFSLRDLMEAQWPDRDPEIENLLHRYVYSFIFGKKYFGAGFGQVSLIGGFHHLILLYALIKLQSRGMALMRGSKLVSMVDVAASVRQSERLVGETKLGGYSAAWWELMLASPARAKRLLHNT